MLKQENVNIADSNIANYGSKLHEDAKELKANSEAEFKGAGEKEGIEIWRIENFGVKRFDKNLYGTFFSGDSFLVLQTYKKNPQSQALLYNLFFWLGSESSQDEKGTCAYKAVELDDFLGGRPVQHREIQGHESALFLSVFNGQIKILDGGVASAFNTVKPTEYKPRLLHCKGKRLVRVTQLPLAVESLNQGDVFILDAGLEIFTFVGKSASVFEKRKANEIVDGLKNERLGKPKNYLIEGDEEEGHDNFWQLLGGRGKVGPAIPDDDSKNQDANIKVLLRVSDASGELKLDEIASGKNISKSELKSEDVFILDLGTDVYVWIGKETTHNEKRSAMDFATAYLKQKGRPDYIPCTRIVEGGEPDVFLKAFC